MMYRQGDILIVKTEDDIDGVDVPREGSRLVLAHGEATGHAHAISCRNACLYLDGERMFLRVHGRIPVLLTHEEHSPISIPVGSYRVVRQREYSPREVRSVAD